MSRAHRGLIPSTVKAGVGLAVIALVAAACGDGPTAPSGGDVRLRRGADVRAGDTIAGALRDSSDTARYLFRGRKGQEVAVFCERVAGANTVVLLRAADGRSNSASTGCATTAVPLLANVGSPTMTLDADETFAVLVVKSHFYLAASRDSAAFRFLLYQVQRVPERVPARVASGTVIEGESLENLADVDEFTLLDAKAGDEINVFLHHLGTAENGPLTLVTNPGCSETGLNDVNSASAAPGANAETGRFAVRGPTSCRFTVRRGEIPFEHRRGTLPYRFEVYAVNRRPEVAATTLVAGDTAAESIERSGDVDEFVIRGSGGDRYNLFAQSVGDSSSRILVTLPEFGDEGRGPALEALAARREALLGRAIGTFTLPATGVRTVRVTGSPGAYRLFVHRVDPRPETALSALVLGDSVADAIELAGDVDEYTVTVPRATLANLFLILGDTVGGLSVDGLPPLSPFNVGPPGRGASPRNATGRFELPAGTHTLRVRGGDRGVVVGRVPYRLGLFAVDTAPEGVAARIAVGDTIREALHNYADEDRYALALRRGERVWIAFLPGTPGTPMTPGLGMRVIGGNPDFLRRLDYEPHTLSAGVKRTARIDVEVSGTYSVRMFGSGVDVDSRGPYRLVVERANVTPESRTVDVALGELVADERLDFPGDVDEFILTGPPGTASYVHFTHPANAPHTRLEVADLSTAEVVFSTERTDVGDGTGTFSFPPSGRVRLSVLHSYPCRARDSCWPSDVVGSYQFTAVAVRPAP